MSYLILISGRGEIMDLMTISQVSKSFSVSTRTLRYYEQIELLSSQKQEGYAYRTYNKSAVRRLQQVLVLRKLRIPLKQIKLIFCNDDLTFLVEVFRNNRFKRCSFTDANFCIPIVRKYQAECTF